MIDLPLKAEVHCSDGAAGYSTYVIGNPVNRQITHLVVRSSQPPFHEVLVPLDQVEETTPTQILLNCTLGDLRRMKPFEVDDFIPTELPEYLNWPYVLPALGIHTQPEIIHVQVKHQNLPPGEFALRRGARVEATDGYVGQVDELRIDSNTMQVTHLVLVDRHGWKPGKITIPVSQIDRVCEDTVTLKLDRQSIEGLPTTPSLRWQRDESEVGA